ncbi:MAG: class I SAM-dependent methyltransferase [Candidatus Aenigmarchaeota archaeon]|nr:class I SAM-dependent methyltransferase [Candidatus Aenigmarchaeota archaeon]
MEKAFTRLRRVFNYEETVFRLLAPHVTRGRVLSVGCGQGEIERLLQDRLRVAIEGVEVTRYRVQKIPTALYDGKRLPFPDKSFDTCLFVYILHHAQDRERLLREAARVTKGSIIILDHTYTNQVSKALLSLYDYAANLAYRMPIPLSFLRVREWRSLFQDVGLQVQEAGIPSSLNVFFSLRPGRRVRTARAR